MIARPARRYLAVVFAVAAVIILISAGLFLTVGRPKSPNTSIGTSGTTTTTTVNSFTTTVSGVPYDADNVTAIMVTSNSFHFDNGSVTFLGVDFQTICTTYAGGCPGVPAPPPGVTVVYPSGSGITVNVLFSDHHSETIEGSFPILLGDFYTFTQHTNPQAGILITHTNSSPGYKSYFLVSIPPM